MDLQQLRYVVAVAETRSFTRAAQACFVVQSGLSHQIKALEKELGVKLFARTSRKVALTTAGEVFVARAREALRAAELAVQEAAASAGTVSGNLTLGINPTLTAVDVPSVLHQYRMRYPDVHITLISENSGFLMQKARRGRVDVTFLALEENQLPENVAYRELSREPLDVLLWPEHPLASRAELDLADIASEVFVDFPVNTSGRAQSDIAFLKAGIPREVAFEVSDVNLMTFTVEGRLAISLLARSVAAKLWGLSQVPLRDAPKRVQYMAWSDFNPSPAAKAFVELVCGA